jgi:hypothetical protein
MLERKGLITREGRIVDASFTDAPRQCNTRKQSQQIKDGKRPEEFDASPSVGRQKDCEGR